MLDSTSCRRFLLGALILALAGCDDASTPTDAGVDTGDILPPGSDASRPETGAPDADTDGTSPPGGVFGFADIPDVVFVEKMAEDEELGIFVLDPGARAAPGDRWWITGARLQLSEDHGGGDYHPRAAVGISLETVGGSAPAGVSYDTADGVLTYDGATQQSAVADWTVMLSAKVGGATVASQPFRVRVLRPTIVFGAGATSANIWGAVVVDTDSGGDWHVAGKPPGTVTAALVGTSTDSAPNVVFIAPGTYDSAHSFYTGRG